MKLNERHIKQLSKIILVLVIGLLPVLSLQAQVRKEFSPRTGGTTPPPNGIYNLRGDFTMIGNTNMSRTTNLNESYDNSNNNSNATMNYVRVDPTTVNSSTARLAFYEDEEVKPVCSKIVYAGLYWTGRAHTNSNPMEFVVNLGTLWSPDNRTLNKRKVKIKGPGASGYTEITANEEDIRYPGSNDDYMYAGYADVTGYVQQYGVGNYTVADLALVEGNGGSVGYFGGWSMVVIYENAKMSWKDIVVFDGYAYLDGPSESQYELDIDGFNAVQGDGDVNVKIGLMAGEGDRGISNDYFQMRRRDNNNWEHINHELNRPTGSGNRRTHNFFNSSINTGGNYRYPNYVNNTGLDIAMFNLDNADKRFITNSQTSTAFRYGSNQDTYVIPLIVIGIDAYIPEVEAVNELISINNQLPGSNLVIEPDQVVEYKITLKNKGDEPVNNVKIEIPVPFTGTDMEGYETFYHSSVQGAKTVTHEGGQPGRIVWDVGNLPLLEDNEQVLAELTYKIQVTTDCAILNNSRCLTVSLNGTTSGEGADTGIPFYSPRLISGFDTSDECADIPLYEPFHIEIDPTNYFNDPNNDCEESDEFDLLTFEYCDIAEEGVPVDELRSSFPSGTKFYADVELYNNPDDEDDELEYARGVGTELGTTSNPFPATPGTHGEFYAIPPGFLVTCYWRFEIIVEEFCGNFWVGTADNLWSNDENWTINIPAEEEDVIFATHNNNKGKPAIKDLHVDGDYIIGNLENNSDKDLIVKTGNSLTIKGTVIDNYNPAGTIIVETAENQPTGTLLFTTVAGNTNVDATVQFYNKAYTCNDCGDTQRQQWQYFGIPVKESSGMPFPTGVSGTVNMWKEAQPGDKWVAPEPTGLLKAFTGYEINDDGTTLPTAIYEFSGKLNVNNATVPLTYNSTVNYAGWNLIGNSYTAAIPIATAITYTGGWDQTVYLFNTGSRHDWRKLSGNIEYGLSSGRYQSVPLNTAGSGGLPSIIPSMHAFMIKATTGGTMTLDYSKLTKNALVDGVAWRSTLSQPAKLPYIVMDVISSESADRVWLFENRSTTRGFDAGWDGEKMAESGLLQLYVAGDDDLKLQVATVPQLQDTYLGLKPTDNENIIVSFLVSSDVEPRGLYLRDRLTGRTYPIKNNTEYTLPGVAGENSQRFKVVDIAQGDEHKVLMDDGAPIEVFVVDRRITVANKSDDSLIATVYDIAGRVVMKQQIERGTTTYIHTGGQLPDGVYMVKVRGRELSADKRVMVR